MALVLKSSDMHGIDAGRHTTVAAADTIQTDLRDVHYAVAQIESDLVVGGMWISVEVPDQDTSPGQIIIKTWKPTAAGNATPAAATTFSLVTHWIAIGR